MAEVDLAELERYLRIFQENPDSRVFAPLADLYRRLSKLKEAEEICRDGIRRHPYYAGGRVALAHILLDKGALTEALSEADSVVTYYPDNLLARKILIRVLGAQGETDRAKREYEALKHLAPVVASDPDLEKALQGPFRLSVLPATPGPILPATSGAALPATPGSILPAAQGEALSDVSGAILSDGYSGDLIESGGFRNSDLTSSGHDLAPSLQRQERLTRLLRRKLIVETWLQNLSA